jgi:Tfp pilus tip-associated adhesin PilY1
MFLDHAGGWTMAINPATGGAFTNSFFGATNHTFLNVDNLPISGIALSGTGSPTVVMQGTNTYMVTQAVTGSGVAPTSTASVGTPASYTEHRLLAGKLRT